MRLAEFILANIEPILTEWESFARSLSPGANLTVAALRDDAEAILMATTQDMLDDQSVSQRASKSKGDGGAGGAASVRLDNASDLHGVERVGLGFHITDVVSEYRALRASVLRLWRESLPQPDLNDVEDIARFDESLDQSLARSVGSYAKRIDESRQMFLAILSHDLRNPLSSIRTAADVLSAKFENPATSGALSMIRKNTDAMTQLITDLIDFSSTRLGHVMPLHRGPVDLEALCQEVIESCRAANPGRVLRFRSAGDVNGVWDAGRIRQVVWNLMQNAIQHGSPDGTIDLSLCSTATTSPEDAAGSSTVELRVHNEGPPIPPSMLQTIFDPLVRYATREQEVGRRAGSIGLGLYIVREIVVGKGGTVSITSTLEEGTTFTVRIPRFLPVDGDGREYAADDEQRQDALAFDQR